MKKRLVCLSLALLMCSTQVVSVSAAREDELREDQVWTSMQLDATYDYISSLWTQKDQLESEIAALDSTLVDVMVSIDVLKNDISNKEVDIVRTKQDLGKAQKARDKQYASMKQRIQYLYEKGGNAAWFQMMMGAEDIADLLTKAEYTQQMYEQDRKSLEKYVNTIEEVKALQAQYESEQAELEEMKASLEQQSAELSYQIEVKQASSAECDNEIAYAQQQATEYANWLVYLSSEIERLEAERIAAEEAARRQAEEEAARAAAEAAAAEDEDYSEDSDSSESYDEGESYSDNTEYDEYGNVIDTENTVSEEEYSSQTSSSGSSYSGSGSSVVDYATQFVGNPYVWGGTSLTNGADCSGFVQSVYANFGVSLPRTSYEQQNAGTEVSYADAQPGDLICYGGHVAIYMGNGQIVHASNSVDGIKISNNAAYRTITSVRRLV